MSGNPIVYLNLGLFPVSELSPVDTAVSAPQTARWQPAAGLEDDRRVVVLRPPQSVLTGLWSHLLRLPRYSDLLWTLTVHRIKVRYKQSLLGWAWAVLQPLLLMLISMLLLSMTSSRVPSGTASTAIGDGLT